MNLDEYDLYELHCMKNRIYSVISKIVIALVINILAKDNFFLMYITVSWFYFFVKIMHNWLLGIGLGIVAFIFVANYIQTRENQLEANIWACILLFGFILIDIINIVRYFLLKSKITKKGSEIRKLSRTEIKSYKEALKRRKGNDL